MPDATQKWRIVRTNNGRLRNSAGNLKSCNANMKNIINKYFLSVITNENMINITEIKQNGEVYPFIKFFVYRIKINELHPIKLRYPSEILSSPLTEIFNKSMTTGYFFWLENNKPQIYI